MTVLKYFFANILLSSLLFCNSVAQAKNTNILLLKTYDGSQDISGWLMSEKLDGMRAIWDGQTLKSRQGNVISAPHWFLQALPPFAIDGELWTQRNDFENITSIVRQQSPDERWHTISYQIFEVPHQQGGLLDRLAILQLYLDAHPSPFVKIIPQTTVRSASHLKKELETIISLGGEGLVVRKPNTPYQTGRSNQALKVKPYQDSECTVIALKQGQGKYLGKLGSLQCQLPSGLSFYIGSGFSDKQRLFPPKIGSKITFKYYGVTKNNVPRFPIFLRIRPQ